MVQRERSQQPDLKKYVPWIILLLAVYSVYSSYSGGSGAVPGSRDTPNLESTSTAKPAQPAAAARKEAGKNRQVEVLVEPLNLRSAPNRSGGNVIGTLTKRSVLTLHEQNNGWLRVSLPDGRSGYVAYDKRYVRIK